MEQKEKEILIWWNGNTEVHKVWEVVMCGFSESHTGRFTKRSVRC